MTFPRSLRRRSNGNNVSRLFPESRQVKISVEQRKARTERRGRIGSGLNCLVLGGGGREYAIAWRLARSDSAALIDVVPGNPGVALFSHVVDFSPRDSARLQQHLAAAQIDLA